MSELLLQADRLLAVGLIDQAESAYRRASEADPGSADAVVGLGKCQIERGDHAAGHALMLRALEIDPANDAALRLEERLAQVLSARGQSVARPRVTYLDRRAMAAGSDAGTGASPRQTPTPGAGDGSGSAGGTPATNGNGSGTARRGLMQRILGR
jgi:thioredoxin-like negative regulator of GroEL